MSTTIDLLQRATLRLSQDGSIKDRLADAYASHLIEIELDDVPEMLREEFSALCAAMNRETPLPRESPIRASVRKMSIHEASRHAALVVRMFAALARTDAGSGTGRRARAVGNAPIVQLFASEV